VVDACSPKSLPTYRCHYQRLVDAHGGKRLDEITTSALEALRDQTIANAAKHKVERAEATGRTPRSYELDAHGHDAGKNAVRATASSSRSRSGPARSRRVQRRT
jgi:hypothetical protein